MLGFVYLAVVIALCLLVAQLRRSVLGQQMLAVRANERAAAAAGINVARVKITAYAISSFIAGTAGWMYAYNFGSVSAARFGILIALGFVAFAYIGGITMVSGAVIGGLVATEGLGPVLLPGAARHLRQLDAARRRRDPDRHADPEPRGHRRHDVPQAAGRQARQGRARGQRGHATARSTQTGVGRRTAPASRRR